MKDEDLSIAKNIFMKYGGSHFYMAREDEYDHYKSFNISEEQELLWINEYQEDILSRIEVENEVESLFADLRRTIRQYKDVRCFNLMLQMAQRKIRESDSFTKLRIAEELLSVVEFFSSNKIDENEVILNAKNVALDILRNVINNPIEVSQHHKEVDYLKDVIEEENIIKRATIKIKSWENK